MIDTLNKIRQALPKKAIIQSLSFIHIYEDTPNNFRVQANNGKLVIDSPIDFPFAVNVEGDKFIRAIKLCKKTPKFKITKTGKLSIISGKFRALLGTSDAEFPRVTLAPRNETTPTTGLIHLCKVLKPFISDDASRPWSQSILVRDSFAYATNNIIIAKIPCPTLVDCVLPTYTIDSLLHFNEEPTDFVVADNYTGFYFDGDVWMRSSSIDSPWPSVDKLIKPTETKQLPDEFLKHLEDLVPFCEDPKYPIVYLTPDGITTSPEGVGAGINDSSYHFSKFRMEMMMLLATNATHADFTTYPKPCYFTGHNGVTGVIMGLK